jgi:hypothetical protein
MIDDNYIIEHFLGKTHKINRFAVERINKEELEYLQNRYNDSDSLNETILRIYYKIDKHPYCKTCGKKLGFYVVRGKYPQYCSSKCAHNHEDVKNKTIQTCLEKYGVTNGGGSKQAKEKIKQTTLLHYGVECSWQAKEVKEKIIDSHRKNLGVDWPMQSKQVQEKSKQTCLQKYGCEYTGQAEIKKIHAKETFIKHYGYEHNWKHPDVIKQCIENRFKNKIEINHITSSKPEQTCFELLKNKFNKVIRQKRDKQKYPFYCDFYIKDIDTWIEFNGFMTHGDHSFNENDENDIIKLNELKEKDKNHKNPGKNLYNVTIKNWTITDPLKRKIAKDNNLNYLEFFSINEVKLWIENYEKN